jgi:hypothetical protein
MNDTGHKAHHAPGAGNKKEKKDKSTGKSHGKGFNEKASSIHPKPYSNISPNRALHALIVNK